MKLIFCLQINAKVFNMSVVSLWVWVARHAQSTQNSKFAISLQHPKENVKVEADLLAIDKRQRFLHIDTIILGVCSRPDMPILPKVTILLFLCNILRKKWVMKLFFCKQMNLKVSYNLIPWILKGVRWSFPKFPK